MVLPIYGAKTVLQDGFANFVNCDIYLYGQFDFIIDSEVALKCT